MVLRGQWTLNTPHQRGTGTHLNPEGGYLQAVPAGWREILILVQPVSITDEPPEGGGDCSGSAETTESMGGRTIGHDIVTIQHIDKGGDQGNRTRKGTLGQTGECKKVGVPGRTHPGGIGTENSGTHI